MNYPNIQTNIEKIYENTKEVVNRAQKFGIDITAVTKCTGGDHRVAEAFLEGGAVAIGDSRLKNLKDLSDIDIKKWLIRIPMKSEAKDAVLYSDLSLNSELSVLQELNKYARDYKKVHEVLLMLDQGDLREGWFDKNKFLEDLKVIKDLEWIRIRGIGTNSNCAGAIIPEPKTFRDFPPLLESIKNITNIESPIISGGNSGAYYMIEDGTIPNVINNLRLGELILFGHETSYQKEYSYLHKDIFVLEGEVVEIKEKPSLPIGKRGLDAFGKEPVFEDLGIRKRAILAIGKQDINPDDLYPHDKNIKVIGASSDHLLLDLTDCERQYRVGDIIPFRCNYGSALRASTSDYVHKYFK